MTGTPVVLHYEGLRELAQALKETQPHLLAQLKVSLEKVGNVIRDDARRRFTQGVARNAAVAKTAQGFETRVRAGGQAHALVVVGQRLRKTTGLHPNWGALQMTRALLPARAAEIGHAAEIVEADVVGLLHEHGF